MGVLWVDNDVFNYLCMVHSPPMTPTTAVVLAGGAIENARRQSASIQP